MKEATEGFLYLSKRASALLIISDLPSSHRFWKERYFFVSGRGWEYDSLDKEDTLGVPAVWTTPENLCDLCFRLVRSSFRKLEDAPNFALAVRFSGIRPDLSPEDEVIKLKLAKSLSRFYSELIRSDILESSGSRSSLPATLRSSSPSVMKFSHVGHPVAKPTKGELLARVEMLSRRSRSVKRKTPDSLEKGRPAWGKVPRLGTSSSSPSTHARVQGQVSLPPTEVPKTPSLQLHSGSAAKAKDSLGKAAEPPLEVMPIIVWSPLAQSAEPPPSREKELGRKRFEADGDGDSLLSNAEFTAGAVSSILRDFDLKMSGALPVEETLALFLQGVASVSFCVLLCLILS